MSAPRLLRLSSALGLALAAGFACDLGGGVGGGDVGGPCNDSSDCNGDLECDFHGGKGSCQVAHGHESDSESESNSTSTTSGTSSSTTEDPSTSTTEDPSSTTLDPSDTDTDTDSATEGETDETETGETTGDDPTICESFCACMLINCSSFDAYPYADNAACMTACDELDDATLQCYGGFCEDAAVEPSEGLAEHWCEHAWGDLGSDEC